MYPDSDECGYSVRVYTFAPGRFTRTLTSPITRHGGGLATGSGSIRQLGPALPRARSGAAGGQPPGAVGSAATSAARSGEPQPLARS